MEKMIFRISKEYEGRFKDAWQEDHANHMIQLANVIIGDDKLLKNKYAPVAENRRDDEVEFTILNNRKNYKLFNLLQDFFIPKGEKPTYNIEDLPHMIQCNWCEHVFPDTEIIINEDEKEVCPKCKAIGYLMDF